MKTERLTVDPRNLNTPDAQAAIGRAAELLRAGRLVALPTETVYGLGANALDETAVAGIFAAKQRPSWDPVIVHIAGPIVDNRMLAQLVTEVPDAARKLIITFWPGPLTLLLPRSPAVPDAVTANRPLVGVRMPSHPVAFELIRRAGVPIAAPSANLFSHTSPTTAEHVLHDLDGRIDAVLDAGPALHGVESTVLDPCQSPMVIYRPGAITLEQIREIGGDAKMHHAAPAGESVTPREALPSPGVGIRHYAPRARVVLVEAALSELAQAMQAAAGKYASEQIGILLPAELAGKAPAGIHIFIWGRWSEPEELAQNLYSGLRALDGQECSVILCPLPSAEGVGAAIRDRLRKAAWVDSPGATSTSRGEPGR